MGALLYFAIFAGLFFLMMRFGCGAHVTGHGGHSPHGEDGAKSDDRLPWPRSETAIDPVCRMSVQTDTAKSTIYRGEAFYFCSAEHRETFEADPERYAGFADPGQGIGEHHHD
ncbi:MAG: YHS domain-containing protein [Rhodobacteraceae bacterium]|nr:YHS domain-containing protein [Paracoccaceae bacterium]